MFYIISDFGLFNCLLKNEPVTRWIHDKKLNVTPVKTICKMKCLKSQRFGENFSLHRGEVLRLYV